jgi:hypothetical protein
MADSQSGTCDCSDMSKIFTRIAFALLAFAAPTQSALAQAEKPAQVFPRAETAPRIVRSQSWAEQWDPIAEAWVRLEEYPAGTDRIHSPAPYRARQRPLGVFGPFFVIDATTAALMGSTNSDSPADFERMRSAFPRIMMLKLIDAPGTTQDVANLQLGRMIRSAGISTHVPTNGSVRSGAVELFLAGTTRTMEPGAMFAVHSWRDERGRGPQNFSPEDPVNRLYTAYYEDMGMSPTTARAFYNMTNSVPHSSALWFGPEVMRSWIAPQDMEPRKADTAIQLAFDPTLISQPFAPLDEWPFMATARFAHTALEPFARPELRLVFSGI